MYLYRKDTDGHLWAREISRLGRELDLTEIATGIRARKIPEDEFDAEVMCNVDSSVPADYIRQILQGVRDELKQIDSTH
jgi:hypothetical protein